MGNTTPVRIFNEDLKRLNDQKAHPRETLADVLSRCLDTYMSCRGMAPLSDENADTLGEVLKELREKKVDASALEAMDVIFKAAARGGLMEAGA